MHFHARTHEKVSLPGAWIQVQRFLRTTEEGLNLLSKWKTSSIGDITNTISDQKFL